MTKHQSQEKKKSSRIELPAANPIERPHRHQQTDPVLKRDIHDRLRALLPVGQHHRVRLLHRHQVRREAEVQE